MYSAHSTATAWSLRLSERATEGGIGPAKVRILKSVATPVILASGLYWFCSTTSCTLNCNNRSESPSRSTSSDTDSTVVAPANATERGSTSLASKSGVVSMATATVWSTLRLTMLRLVRGSTSIGTSLAAEIRITVVPSSPQPSTCILPWGPNTMSSIPWSHEARLANVVASPLLGSTLKVVWPLRSAT